MLLRVGVAPGGPEGAAQPDYSVNWFRARRRRFLVNGADVPAVHPDRRPADVVSERTGQIGHCTCDLVRPSKTTIIVGNKALCRGGLDLVPSLTPPVFGGDPDEELLDRVDQDRPGGHHV